jgi:2'-5' RNA ligase
VNGVPEHDLFGDVPPAAPPVRQPRTAPAQPRHTWFFALRPGAADAARIDAVAARLMALHGVTGKRTGPDRLHVTLDLVGHDDLAADTLAAASAAADAVRLPAFDARFDAAMTFDAPSGPFVLLGGGGLDAVRALRTALGCALADQGLKLPLPYEPHLTLGYDPRHRVARTPIEPLAFRCTGFSLVRSHIGLSRHEVLRSWPLGD